MKSYNQCCTEFERLWHSIYEITEVVISDVSLFPSYIVIDLIQIKHSERKKGIGTKIVKKIIDFANEHEKDVLLIVDESFGTPKQVLLDFYTKLGFVPNKNYHAKEFRDYLIYKHKQSKT